MTAINNQDYLLKEQYQDASNLNARIALHVRFSANQQGWHQWVFEQLDLAPQSAILELGAGPGRLWLNNQERIPPGWQITVSDFSPGMVETARQNLRDCAAQLTFAQIDAQAIPLPDASLDGVIANHMLYHVPNRPQALAAIRRVLKPGGRFYATANGISHLRELDDLMASVAPGQGLWGDDPGSHFNLETGGAELGAVFGQVELRRYPDALVVPEAGPVLDFILSTINTLSADQIVRLRELIEARIAAEGAIRITKDSGIFCAC